MGGMLTVVRVKQDGPLHLHLRPVQLDDAPEASSHLGPVHEHELPLQETHSGPLQEHESPLQDVHLGPVHQHEPPLHEVHSGPVQPQLGSLQVSAIAYCGARSPVDVRTAAIPNSIDTASIHRIAFSIIGFDKSLKMTIVRNRSTSRMTSARIASVEIYRLAYLFDICNIARRGVTGRCGLSSGAHSRDPLVSPGERCTASGTSGV
jgi:hypothetical protein